MTVLSNRSKSTGRRSTIGDCGVYLLWVLSGVLGVASLLGVLTIGVFILPFAVMALALAARRTAVPQARPHCVAGIMAGPAIAVGWLGALLTDFQWGRAWPYLVMGGVLMSISITVFVVAGRRHRGASRPAYPDDQAP